MAGSTHDPGPAGTQVSLAQGFRGDFAASTSASAADIGPSSRVFKRRQPGRRPDRPAARSAGAWPGCGWPAAAACGRLLQGALARPGAPRAGGSRRPAGWAGPGRGRRGRAAPDFVQQARRQHLRRSARRCARTELGARHGHQREPRPDATRRRLGQLLQVRQRCARQLRAPRARAGCAAHRCGWMRAAATGSTPREFGVQRRPARRPCAARRGWRARAGRPPAAARGRASARGNTASCRRPAAARGRARGSRRCRRSASRRNRPAEYGSAGSQMSIR